MPNENPFGLSEAEQSPLTRRGRLAKRLGISEEQVSSLDLGGLRGLGKGLPGAEPGVRGEELAAPELGPVTTPVEAPGEPSLLATERVQREPESAAASRLKSQRLEREAELAPLSAEQREAAVDQFFQPTAGDDGGFGLDFLIGLGRTAARLFGGGERPSHARDPETEEAFQAQRAGERTLLTPATTAAVGLGGLMSEGLPTPPPPLPTEIAGEEIFGAGQLESPRGPGLPSRGLPSSAEMPTIDLTQVRQGPASVPSPEDIEMSRFVTPEFDPFSDVDILPEEGLPLAGGAPPELGLAPQALISPIDAFGAGVDPSGLGGLIDTGYGTADFGGGVPDVRTGGLGIPAGMRTPLGLAGSGLGMLGAVLGEAPDPMKAAQAAQATASAVKTLADAGYLGSTTGALAGGAAAGLGGLMSGLSAPRGDEGSAPHAVGQSIGFVTSALGGPVTMAAYGIGNILGSVLAGDEAPQYVYSRRQAGSDIREIPLLMERIASANTPEEVQGAIDHYNGYHRAQVSADGTIRAYEADTEQASEPLRQMLRAKQGQFDGNIDPRAFDVFIQQVREQWKPHFEDKMAQLASQYETARQEGYRGEAPVHPYEVQRMRDFGVEAPVFTPLTWAERGYNVDASGQPVTYG